MGMIFSLRTEVQFLDCEIKKANRRRLRVSDTNRVYHDTSDNLHRDDVYVKVCQFKIE